MPYCYRVSISVCALQGVSIAIEQRLRGYSNLCMLAGPVDGIVGHGGGRELPAMTVHVDGFNSTTGQTQMPSEAVIGGCTGV